MGKVLEITFVLILLYLVLSRATAFSNAVRSVGKVYVDSVVALQGR